MRELAGCSFRMTRAMNQTQRNDQQASRRMKDINTSGAMRYAYYTLRQLQIAF